MQPQKAYNDVFISYSRKDIGFARQLVERLHQSGREAWIDWGDLSKGSQWWPGIQGGIESADNFVFLLTPDSLASPACHLEIAHARAAGKRIVPVVHIEGAIETAWAKSPPLIRMLRWRR